VPLPDELHDLPPGPELAVLLASLDPTDYTGFQLVDLLAARQRQSCHDNAQLLSAVRELAFSPHTAEAARAPVRDYEQDPYARVEMAFALTWTDTTAQIMVSVARSTIDKTPSVHAAMRQGRLDLDKAKVIAQELANVDDPALAQTIVARLLPEIERCTTPQLRMRLRRLILSVDPDAVRTRHQKALADRCVQHDEYANGTASLSGVYLAKDRAAAAWDHIDAIARATKAAGDPLGRPIDAIRADVFADLLAGVDPALAGAAVPAPRKGTVHLNVDLATLACLSQEPGEITGFGPVLADIARETAEQMAEMAQWRFTVTDDNGDVCAEGRLRYRPTVKQAEFVRARDRTCRAPGCRRPAIRCDIDHLKDWAHLGPTVVSNLCCLCRLHHRAKHVGRYLPTRTALGVSWTTPRGRRYTTLGPMTQPPSRAELDVDHVLHGTPTQARR
jgi:hypothetical protein